MPDPHSTAREKHERAGLEPLLAVILARGGSKRLPCKNVPPLVGLPLITHSIRFAELCPEINAFVVSTDDAEIAAVAQAHGGQVPFMRPAELARDDSLLFRPFSTRCERWSG